MEEWGRWGGQGGRSLKKEEEREREREREKGEGRERAIY
jgi:hypothetical protein